MIISFIRILIKSLSIIILILLPDGVVYGDVFTTTIEVDETSSSSVQAKEIAIAKGKRKAFYRVLYNLSLGDTDRSVPQLSNSEIEKYILSISVAEEKIYAKSYTGEISYSFNPDLVRKFLHDVGIRFSEIAAPISLLIPVLKHAGAVILWDRPNPWYDAFVATKKFAPLRPIVLPHRDFTDMLVLSPAEVFNKGFERLEEISNIYALNRIIVMRASTMIRPSGGISGLRIEFEEFFNRQLEFIQDIEILRAEGEEVTELMKRAARQVLDNMSYNWKKARVNVATGKTQEITLRVFYRDLAEWLWLQELLSSAPIISNFFINSLNNKEAMVRLSLRVSEITAEEWFRRQGLFLHLKGKDYWWLRKN